MTTASDASWRDALWRILSDGVFPADSSDRVFNPYLTAHPDLDLPDAPARRRANLRAYLDAYPAPPPVFVLLEAPGPWGCRFSGVPITSEAQLLDPSFPLEGTVSGAQEAPHTEYSAGIFWRVLQPYFPHFFIWSSVPLHPHKPREPLTIRTPTTGEVKRWAPVAGKLLEVLQPAHVAAVGRKAERALKTLGQTATYVRHPSQGGARQFEEGITALLAEAGVAPGG